MSPRVSFFARHWSLAGLRPVECAQPFIARCLAFFGVFWLETPVEKGRIEVEDAPFIATALTVDWADGVTPDTHPALYFTTNVDDHVLLDAAHPLQMLPSPDGSGLQPYIEVRQGLLAKLSRPVYYELAARAVAGDDGRIGVWSHDHFFILE